MTPDQRNGCSDGLTEVKGSTNGRIEADHPPGTAEYPLGIHKIRYTVDYSRLEFIGPNFSSQQDSPRPKSRPWTKYILNDSEHTISTGKNGSLARTIFSSTTEAE
jgi:hypothetical protein